MTLSKTSTEQGQTLQERLRALAGGMTPPMLAKMLGLSKVTIYKKASAGDIPCLRIGGTVRFPP